MTCEPVLFHTGPSVLAALAADTGAGGLPAAVVVDWESRGKARRQGHARRTIALVPSLSEDGPEALERVRLHLPGVPVICRIDGPADLAGVDRAVAGGAAEVLVPMGRHEDELDRVLEHVAGRVRVGIMVETTGSLDRLDALLLRPLARAYVGLVDLALERGTRSIFDAFADGTVDHVATRADGRTVLGVGGLTLPGHGRPVPGRLLAAEISRVGAGFAFLRRSFLADLDGRSPAEGMRAVRAMLAELAARTAEQVAQDRAAFAVAIGAEARA